MCTLCDRVPGCVCSGNSTLASSGGGSKASTALIASVVSVVGVVVLLSAAGCALSHHFRIVAHILLWHPASRAAPPKAVPRPLPGAGHKLQQLLGQGLDGRI